MKTAPKNQLRHYAAVYPNGWHSTQNRGGRIRDDMKPYAFDTAKQASAWVAEAEDRVHISLKPIALAPGWNRYSIMREAEFIEYKEQSCTSLAML